MGAGVTPYERVTAALRARDSLQIGGNWQCPSHDDRRPSLSVKDANHETTGEPTALMFCHAGCDLFDEVLPALGLQPSDLFPGSGGGIQAELFPASRYSPVGLDILAMLPPGAERSFMVASALGRYVKADGSRAKVQSRREIAAVILERKHRKAVERVLGMTAKHLRKDAGTWCSWGIAHRCGTKMLTVLVRRVIECPVCKAPLTGDVSVRKAPLAGDVSTPQPLLAGGVFQRAAAATTPGFINEVDGSQEPDVRNTYTQLQTNAARLREHMDEERRRAVGD